MPVFSYQHNFTKKINRNTSPMKQNFNKIKSIKQLKQEQINSLTILLGIELAIQFKKYAFNTLKNEKPKPKMITHTVYVWEEPHQVKLPQNIDLFEGIKQFYPNLYQEIEREKEYYALEEEYEKENEKEAVEEFWAHQDYLEWLCD